MAWTSPKTFVANAVLTAAEMNTHLRDNLLETCPPTATAAGDIIYADAANSMGSRLAIGGASNFIVSDGSDPLWRAPNMDSEQTTVGTGTATSYATLATSWGFSGEVEVTRTTGTRALVLWGARLSTTTAGAVTSLSYSVSGATTNAATDNRRIRAESSASADQYEMASFWWQSLTAGSNTFTLEAKTTAGTATIEEPRIFVMPF